MRNPSLREIQPKVPQTANIMPEACDHPLRNGHVHGPVALRLSLFPLVAAATLSLVACHGAGTVQFVTTLESANSIGREDAPREQTSAGLQNHPPTATGSGAGSSGGPNVGADNVSTEVSTTTNPNGATGDGGVNSEPPGSPSGGSGDDQSMPDPPMADATVPGGTRVAERPRNNRAAADLLDHWGHRSVQSIVERLSLSTPASEAEAADLRALREAAQSPDEAALVPDLQNGDEVRILGAHRGVTYGRWTGGPADKLSIRFDLSGAGPAIRDYPAFPPSSNAPERHGATGSPIPGLRGSGEQAISRAILSTEVSAIRLFMSAPEAKSAPASRLMSGTPMFPGTSSAGRSGGYGRPVILGNPASER